MDVQYLFRVIMPEMRSLEDYLEGTLGDADPSVRDVVTHLMRAGGKRIRPALVFLAAKFGGTFDLDRLLPVAAAAEIIHMATLAHDDIIDGAEVRRGLTTVHAEWSPQVAILAGDYLFAQGFRLLARTGEPRAVEIMANVVFEMCQGEIHESVAALTGADADEKAYLERIGKKTAIFLAESCRLGALMAGADEVTTRVLRMFGWGIGLGFQIVDDVLDLTSSSVAFGKTLGTDLRAGVLTLPVIHGLTHATDPRLRDIAQGRAGGEGDMEELKDILGRSGSFAYAEGMARRFVGDAVRNLSLLPECDAREALLSMADFVVEREV